MHWQLPKHEGTARREQQHHKQNCSSSLTEQGASALGGKRRRASSHDFCTLRRSASCWRAKCQVDATTGAVAIVGVLHSSGPGLQKQICESLTWQVAGHSCDQRDVAVSSGRSESKLGPEDARRFERLLRTAPQFTPHATHTHLSCLVHTHQYQWANTNTPPTTPTQAASRSKASQRALLEPFFGRVYTRLADRWGLASRRS